MNYESPKGYNNIFNGSQKGQCFIILVYVIPKK